MAKKTAAKTKVRTKRGISSDQVDERTLKHRLADELSLEDLTQAHTKKTERLRSPSGGATS